MAPAASKRKAPLRSCCGLKRNLRGASPLIIWRGRRSTLPHQQAWLLAIGRRLRADYDATAEPIPARLAELVEQLERSAKTSNDDARSGPGRTRNDDSRCWRRGNGFEPPSRAVPHALCQLSYPAALWPAGGVERPADRHLRVRRCGARKSPQDSNGRVAIPVSSKEAHWGYEDRSVRVVRGCYRRSRADANQGGHRRARWKRSLLSSGRLMGKP